MKHPIRRLMTIGLAMVLCGLALMTAFGSMPVAEAAMRQLEERPGQVVYQSRQSLTDQQGDRWQVIAFNRVRADGSTSFDVRLVTFPGQAVIDRTRPITLTDSLGNVLTAADASEHIFTDAAAPEPHIGQYNLQPIMAQLPAAIPLQLTIPQRDRADAVLVIAPALIQEWQTVAAYS